MWSATNPFVATTRHRSDDRSRRTPQHSRLRRRRFSAYEFSTRTELMDITQVSPHVYAALNDNTTSNAGIIVASGGAIVIDTLNTPAAGRVLAAEVEKLAGVVAAFVVNTHFHFDHTFGNQQFHCAHRRA